MLAQSSILTILQQIALNSPVSKHQPLEKSFANKFALLEQKDQIREWAKEYNDKDMMTYMNLFTDLE